MSEATPAPALPTIWTVHAHVVGDTPVLVSTHASLLGASCRLDQWLLTCGLETAWSLTDTDDASVVEDSLWQSVDGDRLWIEWHEVQA